MTICLDKVGRTIVPGDFVVYGHALGRCAGLRIGKVLKVETGTEDRERGLWKIIVRGVDDDSVRFNPPRLCKINGTLQYPNRLIRLDRTQVPLTYLGLLDPIEVIE